MFQKLFLGIVLALFSLTAAAATTCVSGTSGVAPTATLSWTAPTTNTDGTAIATPLTYNLYQGTTSGGESATPVTSGITAVSETYNTGLTDGASYYWQAVTVDAHGTLSAKSNEVCKSFAAGTPNTVVITVVDLLLMEVHGIPVVIDLSVSTFPELS